MNSAAARSICGLWVSPEGRVHLSLADADGGRREEAAVLLPFCWAVPEAAEGALPEGVEMVEAKGPGRFNRLLRFSDWRSFRAFVGEGREAGVEYVRSMESQYLIGAGETLFEGMRWGDLRRCQCDIETACSVAGGFSQARRARDRVLAIGLRLGDRTQILELEEDSDEAERRLLVAFGEALRREDPDTIEGHNIFRFDLEFLRVRGRRLGVACDWGRFGEAARFRSGRLKVAERWIEFPRCDIPGRLVFDTYLMVLLYDLTTRQMASYGLKEVARHLGISGVNSGKIRTYLKGSEIQSAFHEDRAVFLSYLADDLRETRGIADLLLPTYFAQASSFPLTMQEASLRGTSGKVDLLMLQEYYRAREALPEGGAVDAFEGGFTRSFERGVFREVWHFDVASLYPSLLLNQGRNPVHDSLGAFIPLLRKLRKYRLRYKNLARAAENQEWQAEYEARQSSYKILINSFYGYLGFSGARFADGDLAAAVTREGRELLQQLIRTFQALGCRVLEADTDGIYLSAEGKYDSPEALLEPVQRGLPMGIELEFDGRSEAMFCYKAKNYALYDGEGQILLRGSALRSRGMEPFLQELTHHLIRWLFGLEAEPPHERLEKYRRGIAGQTIDVALVARSENTSQNPDVYRVAVAQDPTTRRRASLEAALRQRPLPKMGDRITFYIARARTGGSRDWERARLLEEYDPVQAPYDPDFYIRKLNDWLKRYEEFVSPPEAPKPVQQELF
jgi:DNA polymerase elongation subunit (family B)